MRKSLQESIYHGVVVMTAALLLGACSSSPTTYSAADQAVDFSAYKTYAFMEDLAADGEPYQSLESTFLKKAVARQMAQRGFSESVNPDVVIGFAIESQEKIRSRSVPATGIYADPYFGDGFGYGYGYGYGMAYESRIDQYTEGQLRIVALDVLSQRIVWEGTTKERITRKKEAAAEQTLSDAVIEVFRHFPVLAPDSEVANYSPGQ